MSDIQTEHCLYIIQLLENIELKFQNCGKLDLKGEYALIFVSILEYSVLLNF